MALRPVEDYVARCMRCYRQMSALSLAPCPCRDPAKTSYHVPAGPLFQNFWRCAHHQSATQNFFDKRTKCEYDCHLTKVEWWHGGMHPASTQAIIGV